MHYFRHSEERTCFCLENVSPDSGLFAYGSRKAAVYSLTITPPSGKTRLQTAPEPNLIGRFMIRGLEPETTYRLDFSADGEPVFSGEFTTLSLPGGRPEYSFAVIADPHISLDRPDRRGRMYSESSRLLKEALRDAADRGMRAVLIPGDLTDRGTREQTDEVRNILRNYPGRIFSVPGDHDSGEAGESGRNSELSGTVPFSETFGNFQLLGLDTSRGSLDRSQVDLLKDTLSGTRRVIIIAHHNLIKNHAVVDADAPVSNYRETGEILKASDCPWIIYCGHKNVPVKLTTPKGVQLNTPQLPHYPAGYLTVQVYPGGLLHQFVPIRSEILRRYSLEMLYQTKDPAYRPEYRYGDLGARCFFYRFSSE
ncbi:MAG: metallophosphoesterase [Spirochaetia bacterium]